MQAQYHAIHKHTAIRQSENIILIKRRFVATYT